MAMIVIVVVAHVKCTLPFVLLESGGGGVDDGGNVMEVIVIVVVAHVKYTLPFVLLES
jgi:hypothetical protein